MKNTTKIIHVAIIFILAVIFLKYLIDFILPFIVGFIVALLLEPLVRLLVQRGRFSRSLASFIAIILLILIGVSIGRIGILSLYREATELLEAAPSYIAGLQEWLSPSIPVDGILERAGEWVGTQSIRAITFVPGMLIGLLLILLSAFFFMRDREIIYALIKKAAKWVPEWLLQYAVPITKRLHKAAAGFLRSELILYSIVAAVCIVMLWLLKNPYALILGFVIALFDSLPIVGSGLILWPWAGYLALQGNHTQAVWLMVLFGIISVIRNVIGPKILSEQIDMHPLAAIMSIFIGIKAFGPVGILAGPALVLSAQVILDK